MSYNRVRRSVQKSYRDIWASSNYMVVIAVKGLIPIPYGQINYHAIATARNSPSVMSAPRRHVLDPAWRGWAGRGGNHAECSSLDVNIPGVLGDACCMGHSHPYRWGPQGCIFSALSRFIHRQWYCRPFFCVADGGTSMLRTGRQACTSC